MTASEVDIVFKSDVLSMGTTLTGKYPSDVAPFREGVYLVEVSPSLWKFAFYTVEALHKFYPQPGIRGKMQTAYIPGHWSEPADTPNDAARNVAKRDMKVSYEWIGLSYKH